MARMIGQSGWFRECKDCCGVRNGKKALRRIERQQWLGDFVAEAMHEDPTYPPGYDHYPEGGNAWPENLSGVDRVTFIPAIGV
jgi:hypothetical protein